MPSNARNEILAAIRGHLAASAPHDAVRHEHHTPLSAASAQIAVMPTVTRFQTALETVGGRCVVVNSATEAAKVVQSILAELDARRVAVSESDLVRRVKRRVETVAEVLENADRDALFSCDAGITSAQWGIAETGTLVLESGRERHRLVSLVPTVHIALLEAVNLRHTMGEVLALMEQDLSRVVTFITGPSRTSDIELTLAIGVHGPAQLYVVVIE